MKPLKCYLGRMKPKSNCPPRMPLTRIYWSTLGAFLGIYCIGWGGQICTTLDWQDHLFLAGPFGASAVLIYGAPMAEFSQPRNLVLGHLVSALVGVTAYQFVPIIDQSQVLQAAAGVSLSIFAMHMFRCLHPPGGATALIAVIGSERVHALGYQYALTPILVGALILLLIALLINNLSTNPQRHYPVYWF
jgi:CBS-domain-containing membrane protein